MLRARAARAGTTESVIMDAAPLLITTAACALCAMWPPPPEERDGPRGRVRLPLCHIARGGGVNISGEGAHGRQGLADRPIRGEPNPSPGRRLSHAGINERCRRRGSGDLAPPE